MEKIDFNELKQLQCLPLDIKIAKTKLRIREWYDYWGGDVYVSFSGGKDSKVLLDLVRNIYPNVIGVYIDTKVEWSEIRKYVKTHNNITWLHPTMTFVEVIEKYGYPIISKEQSEYIDEYRNTKSDKLKDIRWNGNKSGRGKISNKWKYLIDAPFKISDKCCDILKKNPIKKFEKETGLKPFIGTLACESNLRTQQYMKQNCNAFELKRPMSIPLGFWTEQDILQYIKEYDVDYCSIYGDIVEDPNGILKLTGEQRTGCYACAFGVNLEHNPNKFQRMKITHPKLHNYCINQLGMKKVLNYIKVPYE